MSTIGVALLAIFITLLSYLIYKTKKTYKIWKEKGLKYEEPILFLGNSLRILLNKTSLGGRINEICQLFPEEPIVGYYEFLKPVLVVKDARFAEKVMIKDFAHFVDHGFEANPDSNPLDVSLFTMSGKRWRALRNKLSPIFTTGKLKFMFEQMTEIGNNMNQILQKGNMEHLELQEIIGGFIMDTIASLGFGIDAKNLENPHSQFLQMGKKAFNFDFKQKARFAILTNFPKMSQKLGISFNQREVQEYFVKIIKDTLEQRRENKLKRNDFIDLMLQLRDKDFVEITTKDPNDDYLSIDNSITDTFELTDDLILGQAFIFLTAGFGAASMAMTFTCYELTQNQEIQNKLRQEIIEKVKQHGRLNFESIKEMTYLDMCLKESLRKYPPVKTLFRQCTKEYEFPNGVIMQPGDTLIISSLYIHKNPDYYPEPHKFDPERFSPDVYQTPGTFMPFGDGPRVCIAMRFALLQMKFGLAKILINYKLKLNPKTKPVVERENSFMSTTQDPVYFDLEKILKI